MDESSATADTADKTAAAAAAGTNAQYDDNKYHKCFESPWTLRK
jgi:hypothetical protein